MPESYKYRQPVIRKERSKQNKRNIKREFELERKKGRFRKREQGGGERESGVREKKRESQIQLNIYKKKE